MTLYTPLITLLVIICLIWVIKNIWFIILLNLILIFIILGFSSYFDISGISQESINGIIGLYVSADIVGWGILIHLLIKARKKMISSMDEIE